MIYTILIIEGMLIIYLLIEFIMLDKYVDEQVKITRSFMRIEIDSHKDIISMFETLDERLEALEGEKYD